LYFVFCLLLESRVLGIDDLANHLGITNADIAVILCLEDRRRVRADELDLAIQLDFLVLLILLRRRLTEHFVNLVHHALRFRRGCLTLDHRRESDVSLREIRERLRETVEVLRDVCVDLLGLELIGRHAVEPVLDRELDRVVHRRPNTLRIREREVLRGRRPLREVLLRLLLLLPPTTLLLFLQLLLLNLCLQLGDLRFQLRDLRRIRLLLLRRLLLRALTSTDLIELLLRRRKLLLDLLDWRELLILTQIQLADALRQFLHLLLLGTLRRTRRLRRMTGETRGRRGNRRDRRRRIAIHRSPDLLAENRVLLNLHRHTRRLKRRSKDSVERHFFLLPTQIKIRGGALIRFHGFQ
jgi:hypothetical protein